jgi:hypothetical protein
MSLEELPNGYSENPCSAAKDSLKDLVHSLDRERFLSRPNPVQVDRRKNSTDHIPSTKVFKHLAERNKSTNGDIGGNLPILATVALSCIPLHEAHISSRLYAASLDTTRASNLNWPTTRPRLRGYNGSDSSAGTSSIVSMYRRDSSTSSKALLGTNTERTASLVGSRYPPLPHRSYDNLRNLSFNNGGTVRPPGRPVSPYAYPTRLKRPGFRPSSPAVSDVPSHRSHSTSTRSDSLASYYSQSNWPRFNQTLSPGVAYKLPSYYEPPTIYQRNDREPTSIRRVRPQTLSGLTPVSNDTCLENMYYQDSSEIHKKHTSGPLYYDYSEAFDDYYAPSDMEHDLLEGQSSETVRLQDFSGRVTPITDDQPSSNILTIASEHKDLKEAKPFHFSKEQQLFDPPLSKATVGRDVSESSTCNRHYSTNLLDTFKAEAQVQLIQKETPPLRGPFQHGYGQLPGDLATLPSQKQALASELRQLELLTNFFSLADKPALLEGENTPEAFVNLKGSKEVIREKDTSEKPNQSEIASNKQNPSYTVIVRPPIHVLTEPIRCLETPVDYKTKRYYRPDSAESRVSSLRRFISSETGLGDFDSGYAKPSAITGFPLHQGIPSPHQLKDCPRNPVSIRRLDKSLPPTPTDDGSSSYREPFIALDSHPRRGGLQRYKVKLRPLQAFLHLHTVSECDDSETSRHNRLGKNPVPLSPRFRLKITRPSTEDERAVSTFDLGNCTMLQRTRSTDDEAGPPQKSPRGGNKILRNLGEKVGFGYGDLFVTKTSLPPDVSKQTNWDSLRMSPFTSTKASLQIPKATNVGQFVTCSLPAAATLICPGNVIDDGNLTLSLFSPDSESPLVNDLIPKRSTTRRHSVTVHFPSMLGNWNFPPFSTEADPEDSSRTSKLFFGHSKSKVDIEETLKRIVRKWHSWLRRKRSRLERDVKK